MNTLNFYCNTHPDIPFATAFNGIILTVFTKQFPDEYYYPNAEIFIRKYLPDYDIAPPENSETQPTAGTLFPIIEPPKEFYRNRNTNKTKSMIEFDYKYDVWDVILKYCPERKNEFVMFDKLAYSIKDGIFYSPSTLVQKLFNADILLLLEHKQLPTIDNYIKLREKVKQQYDNFQMDSNQKPYHNNYNKYQGIVYCLNGGLRYDEFKHEAVFDNSKLRFGDNFKYLDDAFVGSLMTFFAEIYHFDVAKDTLYTLLSTYMLEHSFNSLQDYLNKLASNPEYNDPDHQLEFNFFDKYFEPSHNRKQRHYRSFMSSFIFRFAVNRAMFPGEKIEFMPVLTGEQGSGKTSFVQALALNNPDYISNISFQTLSKDMTDFLTPITKTWIASFDEMEGFKQAEKSALKTIISSQFDEFRPKFAKTTKKFPRQAFLIGSTNEYQFLTDQTGNRRFFPITLNKGEKRPHILNEMIEDIKHIYATIVREKRYINVYESFYNEIEQVEEYLKQSRNSSLIVDDWMYALANRMIKKYGHIIPRSELKNNTHKQWRREYFVQFDIIFAEKNYIKKKVKVDGTVLHQYVFQPPNA